MISSRSGVPQPSIRGDRDVENGISISVWEDGFIGAEGGDDCPGSIAGVEA